MNTASSFLILKLGGFSCVIVLCSQNSFCPVYKTAIMINITAALHTCVLTKYFSEFGLQRLFGCYADVA